MGRYCLDADEKRIVRSLIRLDDKRKRGKLKRTATAYDRKIGAAIERAGRDVDLGGAQGEAHDEILAKIQQHIITNTPWERIGETYCGRGTFYAYARRYMFLVARYVGLIEDGSRKGGA